jgi:uncharacterized protein YqeY
MTIADRLTEDLKRALKSGEKDTLSAVRLIKSEVKNKEIEKGESLNEEEINGVLMSLVRQGRESFEQFSKGGRQDLADKEERSISIIQSYLPKQLTADELDEIVKVTIDETGAGGPQDMGRVMKAIMPKVKGRVDGKIVSDLVRKMLGGEKI